MTASNLFRPNVFSEILYEKMQGINAGIEELELYEFRYCLNNLYPESGGWACVELDARADVEELIQQQRFLFRHPDQAKDWRSDRAG